MLRLVFRVETSRGFGPYSGFGSWSDGNLTKEQREKYVFNTDGCHPGIYTDLNIASGELLVSYQPHKQSWVCGFESLDQYQDWFDESIIRKSLAKNNYLLGQYLVKEKNILRGKKQILFNRRASKCLAYRRCDQMTADARNVPPDNVKDILPKTLSGSMLR